jgi:outer membrane protein TolC
MKRHALALLAAALATSVLAAAALAQAPERPTAAQAPERLTLAEVVAIAAGRSPGVSLARMRADEADAKITQSRGALLPSLTGQATMVDRTFNLYALGFTLPSAPGAAPYPALQGPVYDSEARLKVSQPLLDLSSMQKVRASRLGALGARADLGVSSETAAQAAALAYLRAARAEAVLRAREQDLVLAQQLVTLAEAQLAAGTSPSIDVTRARTQVAASRGAQLIARNQRDRALIDLARTLGVDPAIPPQPADTLGTELGASGAPQDEKAAIAFALERRDEVRGEQARLARARADRLATAGERLPRVDVSADWGRSGEHFGSSINTYSAAVAVTVPILDGFRREGRLAEQRALVRESELRSHDLRDQVAAEVGGALLDLASGQEQLAVASERLNLALEEVSQATERFTSGVAGNIEVINAQSSLIRARDADIDARFSVASARVALARAAGVARDIH